MVTIAANVASRSFLPNPLTKRIDHYPRLQRPGFVFYSYIPASV